MADTAAMDRPGRLRAIVATALLLAGLAAGCAGTVDVATQEPCEDALLGPVTLQLAEDGQSTVAVPEGAVAVPLRWPPGYGLRPNAAGGEILNAQGEPVARIGEVVWLGGGFAVADGSFRVCGDVMHEDPSLS